MTITSEPGLGSRNESESSPPSCPEGAAPCTSKNDAGWRRIVQNFTPSWFTVTMGTGIVSIFLHNLPYNTAWIRWISVGFFALNVLLMIAFTTISVARYVLYPQIWCVMIQHPTQSVFLGTFPMGLAMTRKLLSHGGDKGAVMAAAAQDYDTTYAEPLGLLIEGLGACIALIMWGIGLIWLAYAVISIAATRNFPFNMGWWGFTFPLGVWVACTTELGSVLHSTFFDVTAMIGSGCIFLLWLVVAACTTKQAISGEMFFAPCLKNLSGAERLGKKS
ncbi:C4-dicarboxylate transporter/malic acid transport protein [Apiospora phragmitis]|uniref:C4-dicarboxylate transporter/malic acid transport protein n=1 Tax=Apiospora phragmitis TaxID=2905665 RepID=A0ABR1X681_9PEZI